MGKKKPDEKRKKKETEKILKYIGDVQRETAAEIKKIVKSDMLEKKKKKEINRLMEKTSLTKRDILKLQKKGLI